VDDVTTQPQLKKLSSQVLVAVHSFLRPSTSLAFFKPGDCSPWILLHYNFE